MLLVLSVAVLFSSTTALNNFIGTWSPGISFPNAVKPFCNKIFIDVDNTTICSCDGKPVNVTAVRILDNVYEFLAVQKTPTIVVESSSEAAEALKKICYCDGQYVQLVIFRRINENYFLQYEQRYGLGHPEDKKYSGTLFAKVLPKNMRELQAVFESIDDMRGKTGHVICPAFFSET